MHGEFGRPHIDRISYQATGYHNPANSTLQGTQGKHAEDGQHHLTGKIFFDEEVDKRNGKYKADQPGP
ncbi:hypothetical protein D3C87_1692360 [compost metagenome]